MVGWGGALAEQEETAERVPEREVGSRAAQFPVRTAKKKECGALSVGLRAQTYHLLVPTATRGQERRFPSHIPPLCCLISSSSSRTSVRSYLLLMTTRVKPLKIPKGVQESHPTHGIGKEFLVIIIVLPCQSKKSEKSF